MLEWPAVSLDLSPIENLWNEIGIRVRQRVVQSQALQELEDSLIAEWNNIPKNVIVRLINVMRRAVNTAGGRHNRY